MFIVLRYMYILKLKLHVSTTKGKISTSQQIMIIKKYLAFKSPIQMVFCVKGSKTQHKREMTEHSEHSNNPYKCFSIFVIIAYPSRIHVYVCARSLIRHIAPTISITVTKFKKIKRQHKMHFKEFSARNTVLSARFYK